MSSLIIPQRKMPNVAARITDNVFRVAAATAQCPLNPNKSQPKLSKVAENATSNLMFGR